MSLDAGTRGFHGNTQKGIQSWRGGPGRGSQMRGSGQGPQEAGPPSPPRGHSAQAGSGASPRPSSRGRSNGSNSSYWSNRVGEKEDHVNCLRFANISRSVDVSFHTREPISAPVHLCVKHPHEKLLLLLSRFSRVRLCATPQTAAHQAPRSLGFSRQEHWSGLPFPSLMHESEKGKWSRAVMSDS